MCLFPTLALNPKYKPNKKNGGIIPAVPDIRVLYIPIGCQKCMECRRQKKREWTVRLTEDIKTNTNGKFIALTFNTEALQHLTEYIREHIYRHKVDKKTGEITMPEGYDLDNQIATTAIRLFLERWRKKYKTSLRHWFITELGQTNTEHIHLHGIVWTDEHINEVDKIWNSGKVPYGFVWKGKYNAKKDTLTNYVSAETVNYMVKYVSKIDLIHQQYKPIILTSYGMGKNYTTTLNATLNKYNGENTREYYLTPNGTKLALPIYYRNKIYTEHEKELLWLHKLDKGERYVCGTKCTTDEQWWDEIQWHRKRNKLLGYGDGDKDWKRHEYEKQRRILIQASRGVR